MLTKEEALEKIEELKKYVGKIDQKKEEKVVGIAPISVFRKLICIGRLFTLTRLEHLL